MLEIVVCDDDIADLECAVTMLHKIFPLVLFPALTWCDEGPVPAQPDAVQSAS